MLADLLADEEAAGEAEPTLLAAEFGVALLPCEIPLVPFVPADPTLLAGAFGEVLLPCEMLLVVVPTDRVVGFEE